MDYLIHTTEKYERKTIASIIAIVAIAAVVIFVGCIVERIEHMKLNSP